MGWYWRRSTKILPGVRVNWSKTGPSVSVGPRGAKINVGKRGTYVTGGIPGTGLYYRKKIGKGAKNSSLTSNNSSSIDNSQSNKPTSKYVWLIIAFAFVVIALLITGNYITCIILAVLTGITLAICYIVNKLNSNNASIKAKNASAPTPQTQQVDSGTCIKDVQSEDIDIKVTIAEIEYLNSQMNECNDKAKLPSLYRKLMSNIYKLEKHDGVTIQGAPLNEVKNKILVKYRKRMNI